ncbi:hypothetical protein [Pseudomonas putida]|uniref:hypothetical protein n=1 Tax=Pseudomonas putida TaxID=303 RepID=UPI0020C1FCD8|nr:hypothetical protein [Pseudomonas putida]UTL83134.1 hypothetical protein NL778_10150 [Pseudomonas putida]
MTTGKRFTDNDAPGAKPHEDADWPTGEDDEDSEQDERSKAQDRGDYVDEQVRKESERGSGRPDPSRASEAERYSYQPWQKMKP